MVTTRVTREFADQAARLENTNRGVLSALNTDLKVVLALQTDRAALDRVGEHILSTPMRMGAVLGEKADPILLSALAGDRALRNLAGLDSTGTEGEKLEYVTTLEAMAARASRDYVQLCQTDPTEARRLAAGWSAVRSGVRSSFLREGVEAAEASFGVATDALTDRSLGRRPLVAPPPGWQPVGVMAAVARAMPEDMHQRFGDVPLVSQPPERWLPQQGDGYRGWDRFRNRFVAKGGIGRAEQLVRRSVVRVPLSRQLMRAQLRRNLAEGPAATKAYLQRVASNPRRAATLMSLDVDPMVVAAALGPRAMAAVVSGQAVPENSSLARLCDVMARRDRAHMNDLRHEDSGPAGERLRAARLDDILGEDAQVFVNRAWDGMQPPDLSLGAGPLNIEGQAPAAFYETWQQLRTGELPVGGIPDAIIDRVDELRAGQAEPQPQGWADVIDDYAELGQQDRYDPDTGEWSFPDPPAPAPRAAEPPEPPRAADPPAPPPVEPAEPPLEERAAPADGPEPGAPVPEAPAEPGMDDPVPGRPPVRPRQYSQASPHPPDPAVDPLVLTVLPDGSAQGPPPPGAAAPLFVHPVVVHPGQEAKFTLESNGSGRVWKAHDDPEVDSITVREDGSYDVRFRDGVIPSPDVARWAASQVHDRLQRQQEREAPDVVNVQPSGADAPTAAADPADRQPAAAEGSPAESPAPPERPVPDELRAAALARAEAEAREAAGGAGVPATAEAIAAALESGDWRQLDNGALVHRTATVDPEAQIGQDAIIGPDCDIGAGAVVGSRAYLLSSTLGERTVVGADAVLNFSVLDADVALGDRSVAEAATLSEHADVGSGVYLGQQVHVSEDARIGDGACVGPRSPEEAAAGKSPPPASSSRTLVGKQACVGEGAVVGRGADVFSMAELGAGAIVATGVRVHSSALVGASATVREGSDIGLGARVADGADFTGSLERDTAVALEKPPGVQAIIDERRERAEAAAAADRGAPVVETEAAPAVPAGALDPDRAWADPDAIAAQQARAEENPDGPPVAVPPPVAPAPEAPADAPVDDLGRSAAEQPPVSAVPEPRGAENPDRLWDAGEVAGGRSAPAPAPDAKPAAQPASLSLDVPESLLTAPYSKKTLKSGEAPDINAPVPDGPDFVSAGNGRWDVVDDPLVSHLPELPDGGYRVHFHPGVGPDKVAGVELASHAHVHLMDQDVASRQQAMDERELSALVSRNLSREVADGHAPCDEDRSEGGVSQPVLVEVLDASSTPPRTGAIPLNDLSGQAVRSWMRDQDPEVYTPEFVTASLVAAVGGKLKPDAQGVDIVRYFSRDVQPFGKDGKIDLEADPVTVTATEKVTVYNVGRSVAPDPEAAKKALVREDARRPKPPAATVRDIARASGAEVVEHIGAPLGYSAKAGTLNVSEERAQKARLSESQLNGKVLYGAAVARLTADGLTIRQARGAAYVAAERLASKLDVPYTPVKLDDSNRRRLAKDLRDPEFAARITRQADVLTRDLVRDASPRTRGKQRQDSPASPGPPRPRPARPRDEAPRPGPAR